MPFIGGAVRRPAHRCHPRHGLGRAGVVDGGGTADLRATGGPRRRAASHRADQPRPATGGLAAAAGGAAQRGGLSIGAHSPAGGTAH